MFLFEAEKVVTKPPQPAPRGPPRGALESHRCEQAAPELCSMPRDFSFFPVCDHLTGVLPLQDNKQTTMPARTSKASKNGGGKEAANTKAAAVDTAAPVEEVEYAGSGDEVAEAGTRMASWDGPPTKKRHNGDTYRPPPSMLGQKAGAFRERERAKRFSETPARATYGIWNCVYSVGGVLTETCTIPPRPSDSFPDSAPQGLLGRG